MAKTITPDQVKYALEAFTTEIQLEIKKYIENILADKERMAKAELQLISGKP